MPNDEVIIRFDKVSFRFGHNKPILDEVSFSVRRGSKITLMGQNGAGKSTIFQLITHHSGQNGLSAQAGALKLESGTISITPELTIAIARQVISRDKLNLTVREFFTAYARLQRVEGKMPDKIYNIDPMINSVLEVVNLHAPHDRIIKSFSGGQQARLLLASALIQDPDLLLLDEPTNNLDKEGIAHLKQFVIDYKKTCIVISHDAGFLNSFTQGVLYLDLRTRKVEQYQGNYFNVVAQITARIEKENSENARLAKRAIEKKEKANFFAMKGGRLRLLAKRMRDEAEEMEEEKIDVSKEDKTIRAFTIPAQEGMTGEILKISSYSMIKNHKPVKKKTDILLKKNEHLLLTGPNGIGKSTLLEFLALALLRVGRSLPELKSVIIVRTSQLLTLRIQFIIL